MTEFLFLGELSLYHNAELFVPHVKWSFPVYFEKALPAYSPKVRACSVNVKQDWCCPACRPSSHLALIISKVLQLWQSAVGKKLGSEPGRASGRSSADSSWWWHDPPTSGQHSSRVIPPAWVQCLQQHHLGCWRKLVCSNQILSEHLRCSQWGWENRWRFLFLAKSCFSFGVISHTSSYRLLVHLIH